MELETNIIKIDELNDEAWSINRKEPIKAIELSTLTLASSQQLNYKMGEALALKTLGASSTWISKNDDSFNYNHKALELFNELNDKKNIAAVYYNLGANYSYISDFDLSIKNYSLCYATSKEIGDEYGMADGLNGMGTIYYRTSQNDNALEVLHESEEICERLNAKDIYIKVLDGLGEAYYNKGLNDKALPYYIKSATISAEMANKQVEAFAVDGLGRTYSALNKPDEAIFNFNKSLQLRRELNFKPGLALSLFNIGDFYLKQNKNKDAIDNYLESYKLSIEINNKEGVYKVCKRLAEIYETENDFEKSLYYYKIYSSNKNEVVNEKSAQLVKSAAAQNKLLQAQAEKVLFEEKAKELQNFSDSLVQISEIGQQIISSLSVEVIVNTVHRSVKNLMKADGFGIALANENENKLSFPLYLEEGESYTDVVYELSDESRLSVLCFKKLKDIIIADYELEIRTIFNTNIIPKAGKNPSSLIYLPLTYNNKALGVITVQSFTKNAYSTFHVNILKNIATYAAIALQNARLYKNQEEIVAHRTKELLKSKEEIENTYLINKKVSEIGRQITSNLNLALIFKKLHASLSEVMNADCFGVRIYLPKENVIEYKYEIERDVLDLDVAKVPLMDDDNYTVWCLKNKKDIFIEDNLTDYKMYVNQIKVVTGDMPHSLMFTPMLLGEKVLGVITVQSFQKFAYKPFQLDILKTLATYTATALENAYLYQHLEDKVSERTDEVLKQKEAIEKTYDNTRIVSEIGKEISSIFSINEIISKVYHSVNKLMDATMFGIGVFNPETNSINFSGVIEKGTTLQDYSYSTIKDSDRPAVWCFNNQADYVIENFTEEFIKTGKVKNLNILAGDATESIIYVPLTSNNKQIGVITVQSYSANAYTDYHLQLLKSLAVYTAIAIDNASLYSNLESRVNERTQEIAKNYDDTRLLGEIAKELSSSLSIETIITSVYTRINQLMRADAFGIGILNTKTQQLEFNGFRENNTVIENFIVDTKDINRLGALCYVKKQTIIIQDFENEYSKYIKLERKPIVGNDTSSIIYIPLYSKQQVIGVITVQSLHKFTYTNYHVDLLQNLSTSIGIALDNANLYQNLEEKVKERTLEVVAQKEEVEKSYQNTKLLSQIGNDITSTLSIEEIIEKVYKNVNALMDATGFGIGVYQKESNIVSFPLYIEDGERLYDIEYDPLDKNRLTSICFSKNLEILINNLDEEVLQYVETFQAPLQGRRVYSLIYLPLVVKEKVIGVITTQSFKTNSYTDYHLQILKNLAVYIAIALDNAALYSSLDTRVKERTKEIQTAYENTRLLSQIAEDISSALSVEAINSKVYTNINKLMDASMFGIGIANPATYALEFKGFIENNSVLEGLTFDLHDENRLATQCFLKRKEIFISNYQKEFKKYISDLKKTTAGNEAGSIIYLPIFSKENCIGVFTVQSIKTDAYTEYQLNLLRNLAVSIGIALDNANLYQNLEAKVNERTAEVSKQKAIIEEKNKDITDSIKYAKKIQQAVVPNINDFNKNFSDSFILYKPKDIVSGDFYWFKHFEDVTVFAAADCTGHGVPGAFMSIICNDIIDRVLNTKTVTTPSQALKLIDENLVQLIRKTSETSANDGMDIALCAYYRKENRLEFAGANRPMLLCRDSQIIEYKASKFSIGGQSTDGKQFDLISIPLQKDDAIYLFTDGYADQFGGKRGKKFKFKNLKEFLLKNHTRPFSSQKKLLDFEFESWKGELEQVDDVCVIGVKI